MTESRDAANNIISKYTLYAAGAGLVPIPVVDLAALAAVNLAMIQDITKHYGADFSEQWGKSTVAALLGGLTASSVAKSRGAMHVLRVIPIVGQALASVSMSIYGAAATYAVGRVFVAHFEGGGTMLSFDVDKAKQAASEQYTKGKGAVSRQFAKGKEMFKKNEGDEVVAVEEVMPAELVPTPA
jgi:uncharacterized protein (DUF697 family)